MDKITYLEIDLDTNNACNMNCKYCFLGEKNNFKRPAFNKVYFDGLDLSECKTIEFWGGEPFFYFEDFKVIAHYFRQRCPEANLHVVSNGTIITAEIIDFIIEEKIELSLSHDGPDQYIRGTDFLMNDNTVEQLKRLPYKIVLSSSVTNATKGYAEFRDYFYQLEERTHLDFTCKIIPIRGTDSKNMEFAFTTEADGERLGKFFVDLIDDCDKNFKSRIMFCYTLMRLVTLSDSPYPCSVHENTFLSSLTDGTRQVCHSNKESIMSMFGCSGCVAAGQCYVACQVLDLDLKEKQCAAAKKMATMVNERLANFDKVIAYVPTGIVDITHLAESGDLKTFFEKYINLSRPITYYVKSSQDRDYSWFVATIQNNGFICVLD